MSDKPCDAVILAGGLGTRLKPLTASLPKPMVPVGNRPLMEHVVDLLSRHDLKEILVLLFFQAEAIREYFGDGRRFGVSISYLRPEGDFGTAGSVRRALPLLAERFLVIAGDVLTDIDLSVARELHERRHADATIALTRQSNPLPFGIVMTDSEGRITRFLEKPSWGEVFTDTVNTGVYVIDKSLLEPWPSDQPIDFGQDIFPKSLTEGRALYGVVCPGYWRDVGHVDDYLSAHLDLLAGRIKINWPVPPVVHGDARLIAGAGCTLAPDVRLSGTVMLGDRASIGAGVQISDSVIGPGTVVGQGAQISRSVLWSAVSVGTQTEMNEAVVQSGARLGDDVILGERAIVSELCRLGHGVIVHPNCRIWPQKTVEDGARVSSSVVWGEQYNRELFTDAKVSGLTNREMTPEFAARLGAAFAAQFAPDSTLVIARDQSVEARALTEALKSGITSSGVNVRDLRDSVVPILRFDLSRVRSEGEAHGGVYVRRSPDNMQNTDAIFFDANGFDLSAGVSRSVERVFFREDYRRADARAMGLIRYPERVLERYRDTFLVGLNQEAIRQRRFRLIVDYSNGAMAEVLPPLLTQLGVESIALNGIPGETDPAPTDHAHRALSRIVTALEFDLAFHINAAGEKLTLIDPQGDVITGQRLLLLVAALLWRSKPGARVAVPVVATAAIDELAARHRGTVQRVKSDHLAMMAAAARGDVDLVAGTRGGFIFPGWQRGADAAAALVQILTLTAATSADLMDLALGCRPGELAEASIPCAWDHKGALMRRLTEQTAGLERMLIDGIRVQLPEGWLWVAPDRRSAHFRLQAEAASPAVAQSVAREWTGRLRAWLNDIEGESRTDHGGTRYSAH